MALPLVIAAAGVGVAAWRYLQSRREFEASYPSVPWDSVRPENPLSWVPALALEKLGRIDDALARFRAYVKENPDCAFGRTRLANLAHKKGDLILAREQYEAILARDRTSSMGHYGAGYYAYWLEDDAAAKKHLKKLLDLEPRSALAPGVRSMLEILANRSRRPKRSARS